MMPDAYLLLAVAHDGDVLGGFGTEIVAALLGAFVGGLVPLYANRLFTLRGGARILRAELQIARGTVERARAAAPPVGEAPWPTLGPLHFTGLYSSVGALALLEQGEIDQVAKAYSNITALSNAIDAYHATAADTARKAALAEVQRLTEGLAETIDEARAALGIHAA